MHDHVQRPIQAFQPPLHRSPQPAPDAVAIHCSAQHLAHGESYTGASLVVPLAVEGREIPGKMFPALLVNRLKIRVPQQS
jgi:hypothetical protein